MAERQWHSSCNEWKNAAVERFARTLKNKIYKHITTVSKNVPFDVLDDIVDKYNNTYHSHVKMKLTNVKSNSYAEYNVDSNDIFKIGDIVRIS